MDSTEKALNIDEEYDDIYPDLYTRIGAGLLDSLFLLPLTLLSYYLEIRGNNAHIIAELFSTTVFILYYLYLPKQYGGTPGKLILKIKIIKLNAEPIGWKEAFLRYLIQFILTILSTILIICTIVKVDETHYLSLGWVDKNAYMDSLAPSFSKSIIWINCIYYLVDIIVFFSNPQKRALHDYIAGTVVVYAKYLNKREQITA